jgi:arylsulfatase A-like enzyme
MLVLACASGCGRPRPAVVLLVVVDTLRADALGCYGAERVGEDGARPSPRLDALAAEGLRFERAYATAPWTIPSLVSLLSGRFPAEHGRTRLLEPVPPEDLPLAALFRTRGWRTAGVTTNFVATERQGFGNGFERFDDALATGHEGSSGDAAVARLLAFADELRAEPREGLFLFALLFEPHFRYEAHEGLRFGPGFGDMQERRYEGPLDGTQAMNELLARRAELGPEDAEFLRGLYASEVAAADRSIGRLLDGLAERGLADDALVVVTSDHGEELLERGWIGHSVTLFDELVRVPLVVRMPESLRAGRAGVVVEHPVSLVDLPATLVDLATGGPPRAGALGESRSLAKTLLEGARPARRWLWLHTDFEPPLAALADEKRARKAGVVDAETRTKWTVDLLAESPADTLRLYDLAQDPTESRPVSAGEQVGDPRALEGRGALVERLDLPARR